MLNRGLTVTQAHSHWLAPGRLLFGASLILNFLGALSVDAKTQTPLDIPTQSDWEDNGLSGSPSHTYNFWALWHDCCVH